MIEGRDYTLIPVNDDQGNQVWNIRIISGEFIETIIRFKHVAIIGADPRISFNFDLISSPDEDLSVLSTELQEIAGLILEDILVNGIDDGTIGTNERK